MTKFYITVVLICFSILSFSQTTDEPAFRVSLRDLKMETYPQDSTANAVVLYEHGKSFVNPHTYMLHTEIKRKIKILNKEGFDNANISIHIYRKDANTLESIKDIVALTYNYIDGEVVTTKLNKKDIFTEKYDDNHTFIKFMLPEIKPGSVITFSYTKKSPFMFNYYGWEFQDGIPTLYSEYNTSIPANWKYHIKLIGGKKLIVNESDVKKDCLRGGNGGVASCFVAKYAMKNIPAFVEEDYMTSKYNYLARIEYELETFSGFDGQRQDYTKSWETVDKELRTDKNIGRQLSKSIKVEELLPASILNENDKLKKAQAIYHYVQDNYTWNGEFRIFRDVSVKDLIKEKSSNATAINIFLKLLLEESGIDTKPILLSTRNNGFPSKNIPVISEFNYLIVQTQINDKTYLLDATDNYLSFGELPFRCLNQYARLLDFENGSSWIDIAPTNRSAMMYNVNLTFNEDNNLVGTVKDRFSGYNAYYTRKDYFPNEDAYIDELANNSPFIEITNHNVSTEDPKSNSFAESYDIEYIQEDINGNLYLNPFVIKFFKTNPFKLQERSYPIDLGFKHNYLYTLVLNLNNKYSVKELPEAVRLALPNNAGELAFSTTQMGDNLNLTFKLNLKSTLYPAEYYPYLKELMSKAVDIQKNSIIVLNSN